MALGRGASDHCRAKTAWLRFVFGAAAARLPWTGPDSLKPDRSTPPLSPGGADLLAGLYAGRLAAATALPIAAVMGWLDAGPEHALLATAAFLAAVTVTAAAAWRTHGPLRLRVLGLGGVGVGGGGRGRADWAAGSGPHEPHRGAGRAFLPVHLAFDVLLVTAVVHVTGGRDSSFAALYVLVISEGALLLALPGAVLAGALSSVLYLADVVWLRGGPFTGAAVHQVVLFASVALVTGVLGDRLRRAGAALGVARSELRQLRLDTGDILASSDTGVLMVDGAERLVYMNPAGQALLGLDAGQWLGLPVLDAVDGAAQGMGAVVRRTLADRRPVSRRRITIPRNGREVALGLSTTVLARERDRPSVAALFRDISDVERVEALDRRAEGLEAVAALSASLAHEIRNPLTSIRSAVEQIATPGLGMEDRTVLQRLVVGESDRLNRLLSAFLDFTGLRVERREVVDLGSVARDCVLLLRYHPDRRGEVTLDFEPPCMPLTVVGDRDLLHRAVFNLVLNALQFSAPMGTVTVRLQDQPPGRVRWRYGGVRLLVRDGGPGIDPGDAQRIFDPFYSRRHGGSGLGLSVVQRAVEAHEGTVAVERAPGGGALFAVDLPFSAPAGCGAGALR